MTTRQDSVDVERLRAALRGLVDFIGDQGMRVYPDDLPVRAAVAALSLPITQRDEQGGRSAAGAMREACAKVADGYAVEMRGKSARTRDLLERRTLEAHDYAGRNIATAIRRLSIEQGDHDGGTPS